MHIISLFLLSIEAKECCKHLRASNPGLLSPTMSHSLAEKSIHRGRPKDADKSWSVDLEFKT